MNRSPGPTPCSALITNRQPSASSSSCSTRRCIRSVSASRGRWTPGRSTSTSCQSGAVGDAADRAARRLRLVGDDRHLGADDRVGERRLADVRPPGQRDEARPRRRASHAPIASARPGARASRRRRSRDPCRSGAAAVDDRLAQIGRVLRADDDVAELARAGGGPSSSTPNESTSVGSSISRYSRLSVRIRSSSTNSIATWPSSIPAEERASMHSPSARSRREPQLVRRRTSTAIPRSR